MGNWTEFDESDEHTHPGQGSTIEAEFPNGRKAPVLFGGRGLGWSIINRSTNDPISDTRIVRWRYIDDEIPPTQL